MRMARVWLCALAVALGVALPGKGFCDELTDEVESQQPAVQLVTNTSWAEERSADQQNEPPVPPAEDVLAPAKQGGTNPPASGGCTAGCSQCLNLAEGECCPCCGHCYHPWTVVANVEATFLWPQFHRDFLTASYFFPGGAADLATNSALGSTDGSMLVAPRITLGLQSDKWGLVGRYFNATNWATGGFLPALPVTGGAGFANVDDFRAWNISLEVQRRFCLGAWTGYGLFGVQHASLNNDRLLNVTTRDVLPQGGGDVQTTAFSTEQFNGTGITFGFYANRPLTCDSPFSLFVANRYSFLWGNGMAATQTSAQVGILGTATDGAIVAPHKGDMFIAEVQLGLQWSAPLQCFPATAFVRSAMEFQYWDTTTGIFTASQSFVVAPNAGGITFASATDMIVSLIGFNIGAGIMF